MKADIVYIQYTNPACYPPLQHSSRMFANAGMKVLFLGTGSGGSSNSFEFPAHENVTIRRWNFQKPGILQKIHYICFCFWVGFTAWLTGAKWIYASDMFSCPAALLGQTIFGLKIIYHEHDSPSYSSDKIGWFGRVQLYFRALLAKSADIVIFPNEDRAKIFRKQTNRLEKVYIVWNVPSIEEIDRFSVEVPKKRKLFYHGSLNEVLLPLSILDALVLLDSSILLEFAGYSAGLNFDYGKWYVEEANKRGLKGRVRYLGCFSRKDLLCHCSDAMVGLAVFPENSDNINIRYLAGASNKVFDYLACDLVNITSNGYDWKNLLIDRGFAVGCNVNSIWSISSAISEAFDLAVKGNPKKNNIRDVMKNDWNYEAQFSSVLSVVLEREN